MTERARRGWAVAAAAAGFLLTALVIGSLGPVRAQATPAQVCPPLCPSSTAAPTTAAPTTRAPATTRAPTTAPPPTTAAPRTTATVAGSAPSTESTVPGTGEPVTTGSVPLLVPGPTEVGGVPITTAAPVPATPVSNSDNTATVVALVIAGLLLVALLLALLTYWYWRNTRPAVGWADEKASTKPAEGDEEHA